MPYKKSVIRETGEPPSPIIILVGYLLEALIRASDDPKLIPQKYAHGPIGNNYVMP